MQKILKNESAPLEDRQKAGQILSRIHDLVYENTDKAREIIEYSIDLDANDAESFKQLVEVERNAGRFEEARNVAAKMRNAAKTRRDVHLALRAYAETALAEALTSLSPGASLPYPFRLNDNVITEALAGLDTVLSEDLSHYDLLIAQFKLAVLAGKGEIAMQSWARYFDAHNEGEYGCKRIQEAYESLAKALRDWSAETSNFAAREKLALALADGWVFDLAAAYAKTLPDAQVKNKPRIEELIAYDGFLGELKAVSEDYYRESVLAGESHKTDQYRAALNDKMQAVWKRLAWDTPPGTYSRSKLLGELERRFGTIIRQGWANSWYGLLCGHLVIDGDMEVEQYSKKGRLKFKSVDVLAVKSLRDWYFGRLGSIGGWASNQTVYEVRASTVKIPFEAWNFATDPEVREELEKEIAKLSPQDEKTAAQNLVSAPRGFAKKLIRKVTSEFLEPLEERVLQGDELRDAYISEFARVGFESGIIAHEGRHAIDYRISSSFSSHELEYRAKLSEIAFSSHPFLPLANMFSYGVNDTPHGKANRKLIKGLIEWMGENKDQIAGLDSGRPLVLQLDLLTNDQLREAARSLDPLSVP